MTELRGLSVPVALLDSTLININDTFRQFLLFYDDEFLRVSARFDCFVQ